MAEIILSGMRPTGKLHIGHVEGVLTEWTRLQKDNECYYFVADWHAMTTDTDTRPIKENTIAMVKDWLAAGVDPEKSTIFVQSLVPQHAELQVALSNIVNLGRLERIPTFHEYMREVIHADEGDAEKYDAAKRASISYGFLGYPLLQSADILIYKTTMVPVGEDQLPHLELTREIARRFNGLYGTVFPIPKPLLGSNPRILGIDGRKMSKSYGNSIEPTDDKETLEGKIKQLKTDPSKVRMFDAGKPDECSVFDLHNIYSPNSETIAEECRTGSRGCVNCKMELAHNMSQKYEQFREIRSEISDENVLEIIIEGSKRARLMAQKTMEEVRTAMRIDYGGNKL